MQRLHIILIPFILISVAKFAHGQPTSLVQGNATNLNAVTVIYDPSNGQFDAVSQGADLTTIEIQSSSDAFLPAGASPLTSPFDLSRPDKLFRMSPDGASTISFGQVLPPDLSALQILDDLIIDGSLLGGGNLQRAGGGGPYLFVVPEPASSYLVALGILIFSALKARGSRSSNRV